MIKIEYARRCKEVTDEKPKKNDLFVCQTKNKLEYFTCPPPARLLPLNICTTWPVKHGRGTLKKSDLSSVGYFTRVQWTSHF